MKTGRRKVVVKVTDEEREQLANALSSRNALLRDRARVILAVSSGNIGYRELIKKFDRSNGAISAWLTLWRTGGFEALMTIGKSTGRRPQVNVAEKAAIRTEVSTGNYRTAKQIGGWMRRELGITLKRSTLYYTLARVGAALKVPRPSHIKKDQAATDNFHNDVIDKLEAIPLDRNKKIRLWVQDESRVGLQPIWRRMWGIIGERLVRKQKISFEYFWIYGAMEITRGESEFLLLPRTCKELTSIFLKQISENEPDAQHIVIWDGAGFHQNSGDNTIEIPEEAVPDNVFTIKLPPYSPELNPQEKLWDIVKDCICSRIFDTLDDLEKAVIVALTPYLHGDETVLTLIGERYAWILKANSGYPTLL